MHFAHLSPAWPCFVTASSLYNNLFKHVTTVQSEGHWWLAACCVTEDFNWQTLLHVCQGGCQGCCHEKALSQRHNNQTASCTISGVHARGQGQLTSDWGCEQPEVLLRCSSPVFYRECYFPVFPVIPAVAAFDANKARNTCVQCIMSYLLRGVGCVGNILLPRNLMRPVQTYTSLCC
jgi:hypothetical protein